MMNPLRLIGMLTNMTGKIGAHVAVIYILLAYSLYAEAADPSYLFDLRIDNHPGLCTHMHKVFNQYFKDMWDVDPLFPTTQDKVYSSDSRYAFPLLPGTVHDARMTFDMRYSKVPSSPEFDAIVWREGHTVFGGPTGGPPSTYNAPLPYLIAYVDIDNDGKLDTLVKYAFTKGYSNMLARGETSAGFGDALSTLQDIQAEASTSTTIFDFIHGTKLGSEPITMQLDYLRPFIYEGRAYVASYSQGWDEARSSRGVRNLKKDIPPHETMSVLSLTDKGNRNSVGKREWTSTVDCQFDMVHSQ
jgi:hypothetical protein